MNRIITPICIGIFTVLAFSCSKDDDKKDSIPINPLIGTWYENEVIGEPNELDDCEKQSSYTFIDKQGTIKNYSMGIDSKCTLDIEAVFTYTIVGDKIKAKSGTEEGEIPFNINQNVLTLFHPQSSGKFVEIKYIKK